MNRIVDVLSGSGWEPGCRSLRPGAESRLYYDVERGAAKSTGRKNFFSGRTMFPDDFSYKKRRRPVRDAAFRISPVAG